MAEKIHINCDFTSIWYEQRQQKQQQTRNEVRLDDGMKNVLLSISRPGKFSSLSLSSLPPPHFLYGKTFFPPLPSFERLSDGWF
jgi:hypothetical protein